MLNNFFHTYICTKYFVSQIQLHDSEYAHLQADIVM